MAIETTIQIVIILIATKKIYHPNQALCTYYMGQTERQKAPSFSSLKNCCMFEIVAILIEYDHIRQSHKLYRKETQHQSCI
jgi:hypothetical protein